MNLFFRSFAPPAVLQKWAGLIQKMRSARRLRLCVYYILTAESAQARVCAFIPKRERTKTFAFDDVQKTLAKAEHGSDPDCPGTPKP